jgi:hypothetical protein
LAAQTAISADGVVESTSGGFRFPDGSIQTTAAASILAPVADTGQQGCWDAVGNPISCTNTGQDGETQAGVDWPAPRFAVNGDGTITDNLTGLSWLQDANCFNQQSWESALSEIAFLNIGQRTCTNYTAGTFADWRLSNIREILSLIDYGEFLPAISVGHPFINLQTTWYWTSTTGADPTNEAWRVNMANGDTLRGSGSDKTASRYLWPVRGGQ